LLFQGPSPKTVITNMLCADLVSPTGETCTYILAADDTRHLHIIHQGDVVMTMKTPHIATAVSSNLSYGAFLKYINSYVICIYLVTILPTRWEYDTN